MLTKSLPRSKRDDNGYSRPGGILCHQTAYHVRMGSPYFSGIYSSRTGCMFLETIWTCIIRHYIQVKTKILHTHCFFQAQVQGIQGNAVFMSTRLQQVLLDNESIVWCLVMCWCDDTWCSLNTQKTAEPQVEVFDGLKAWLGSISARQKTGLCRTHYRSGII